MGSRTRSKRYRRDSFRSQQRRFRTRRSCGWGMNLYRNTRDGKIAGVCAGLADHWDVAHWVVRLMAVILFCLTGFLAFWAYIAGWCCMAPRPRSRAGEGQRFDDYDLEDDHVEMEYDEYRHDYRPKNVFRYSDSSGERLKRARERLDAALRRVEDMESYVTSRQYNLNKEFSKL